MATVTASDSVKAQKQTEKKQPKKGRNKSLFFLLPLMILLVVFMKAGFLLVLFGAMPTIIAYYADTSQERLKVSTIACCNISGVLPFAVELHNANNNWSRLTGMLSDPMVWLQMYGMAAVGYGLIRFCPMVYHAALRAINGSLAFQMEQRQEALVKEWGEDIRADTSTGQERSALVVVK